MADPYAPYLGSPAVTQAPRTNLSSEDIAGPAKSLANSLNLAGEALTDTSVKLAEDAGVKAVHTDDAGNLVYDKVPMLGPASQAYVRTANMTILNQKIPQIENDQLELRLKFPNDPAGFKAAAKAYTDEQVKTFSDNPHLAAAVGKAAGEAAAHNYRTSLVETDKNQVTEALQTYQARLRDINENSSTLARQGGTATDDYQRLQGERSALYGELTKDKRFNFSDARAALELKENRGADMVQGVIGEAQRIYKTKNNSAEAQAYLQRRMYDEKEVPNLTAKQRDAGVAEGLHALQNLSAQDHVALTENRQAVTGYISDIFKSPSQFDDLRHNDMMQRAKDLNDHKSIADLDAMKSILPMRQDLKRMNPEQASAELDKMERGIVPRGPIGSLIEQEAKRIGMDPATLHRYVQIESGLNPGNRTGSYKGLLQLSDAEFQKYGGGKGLVGKENLEAADKEMKLTPQERSLYERHLTNLTGPGGVDNPDGSRSTLFQAVEEHNGRYYNIPTVWNGKKETEKWTRPSDGKVFEAVPNKTALDSVAKIGWDKFPSYATPEEADERYEQMHKFMEQDTRTFQSKSSGDIFDPAANLRAGTNKLVAEAATFQAKYGHAPTATELYLTHQQGEGGLANHLANPDRPAWQNMYATGEGQQKGAAWAKQAIWGNVPADVRAQYPGGVDSLTSRDFMNIWTRKVEGQLTPGQRIDTTSDSATSRLFQSTIKEYRETVGKNAGLAYTGISSALQKGDRLADGELESFVHMAVQSGRDDLVEKLTPQLKAADMLANLPEGTSATAVQAQVEALKASGVPNVERQALDHLSEMVAADTKALRDQPLLEGGRRGWFGAVGPLDPANPQGFAGEIADREKKAGVVQAHDPGHGPVSVISKDEGEHIATQLTNGDPAKAMQVLGSLGSLSPDNYKATMLTPPIKNAVIGMSGSSDPARMAAGMTTMDRLYRQDPTSFKDIYGEQARDRLQAWQALKDQFSSQEIAERINAAEDPQKIEAMAKIKKAAEAEIKTDAQGVANLLGNSIIYRLPFVNAPVPSDSIQAEMMAIKYTDTYKTLRSYGVDPSKAAEGARKRLSETWAASPVAGGQFMMHPPEKAVNPATGKLYYPEIDGSQSWMTDQLHAELEKVLGPRITASNEAGAPSMLSTLPPMSINWGVSGIVADGKTQAEISSGKPPSYSVAIQSNGTTDIVRLGGKPLRFKWDYDAAKGAALPKLQARDATSRNFQNSVEQYRGITGPM